MFSNSPVYSRWNDDFLKARNELHIENIQDLSTSLFNEVVDITKMLYEKLSKDSEYNVVGINVLFNQISKSQLCIHGHVETMLESANQLNLGYELNMTRPADPLVPIVNASIPNQEGVYKVKEGIRIDLDMVNHEDALKILDMHEESMKKIIKHGRELQSGDVEAKTEFEQTLVKRLNPAPTEYVYLTYYRNKMFMSIVPELLLERFDILGEIEDEKDFYGLKVNEYSNDLKYKLLKQVPPLIRPSIKVKEDNYKEKVSTLRDKIREDLEER